MVAKTETGRRGNSGSAVSVKDHKDASQLGRAAETLLSNKTLNKALREMEENVFEHWTASNVTKDEREEMYRLMKTVRNFRKVLEIYVTKGKNSQKKLEVYQNGGKSSTRS